MNDANHNPRTHHRGPKRRFTIVFAGEFWQGASGRGLSTGFERLGCIVQEVDHRPMAVTMHASLPIRAAARLIKPVTTKDYRQRIMRECEILRPDVFFTIKGSHVTSDDLKYIKSLGIRTAIFYPDVDFSHPGVTEESFTQYDHFFTTKSFHLTYLRGRLPNSNIKFIPHGYSPDAHRPLFDISSQLDYNSAVSYIGNFSTSKKNILVGVSEMNPDLKIDIIGSGWNKTTLRSPLSAAQFDSPRMAFAYSAAIQLSMINISVHHGLTASGWEDLVSTRTFEIPACGGFMLHVDNLEVRELFRVGEEIDVFSDIEELSDKIRYYTARPEVRNRMVSAAYGRCVPAYSYHERAREILDCLRN